MRCVLLIIALLALKPAAALEVDFSGNVGWDGRLFHKAPAYAYQARHTASAFAAPELRYYPENSSDLLQLSLFARLDATDKERNHFDIRSLNYVRVGEAGAWELKFGIAQEFWGVTESQNLVNIINQSDSRESLITDAKMGQPLIKLTLLDNNMFAKGQDFGSMSFYVLPWFRTAGFAGKHGRLRPDTQIHISNDRAKYESAQKERHVDYALRWKHSLAGVDIGLSYFKGTNRLPSFYGELQQIKLPMSGNPIINVPSGTVLPYYAQISQYGIDMQYGLGGWLFKLEAISRSGADNYFVHSNSGKAVDQAALQACRDSINLGANACHFSNKLRDNSFNAYTAGFEYSVGTIANSNADMILVLEYNADSRGREAFNLLQNDVLLGARIALNNNASTTLVLGFINDLDSEALIASLEMSTRLSNRVNLEFESRNFLKNSPRDNMLWQVRQDDYTQLAVQYFF